MFFLVSLAAVPHKGSMPERKTQSATRKPQPVPVRPARLEPGDRVGIVLPASPPPSAANVDLYAAAVEGLGFKPVLAPHLRGRLGYLAGSDRQRAGDLMKLFADPKIKAILCARGGYGCTRILPLLDFKLIRKNPKILVGYSDITALQLALLAQANLVSFHGPMVNSDFIKPSLPEFTRQGWLRTLTQAKAPGSLLTKLARPQLLTIRPGVATGRLVGGNLSMLCSLVGTPYLPDFKKRILFLEDLNEAPYRIDRMLTQLLNAGLLQQVAGVAIGQCRDCLDPRARDSKEYRQTVEEVFTERLRPLGIPAVLGLPFGHVELNATLPQGIRARLDANQPDLIIDEPAVSSDT
jgi:muramoyltetrapeptide carboxypeptidase